jgi:hypothetical protein
MDGSSATSTELFIRMAEELPGLFFVIIMAAFMVARRNGMISV